MPLELVKPTQSDMDKQVDALFQVLPAKSHKEIARKMSKELGRRFRISGVGDVLLHVRNNSYRYGWTVPHAKRGTHPKDEKGNRFFHVLVERGRDPEFDVEHEAQLNDGLISTVTLVASSTENESEALKLAANYCRSQNAKRWVRSLARRLKQIGEDTREIVEMLHEENGEAA